MNKLKIILVFSILMFVVFGIYSYSNGERKNNKNNLTDRPNLQNDEGGLEDVSNPLSIETLRLGDYSGSDIVIEETLASGSNYDRYIASYKSEGLKIYSLLTVPTGFKPKNGWPVVIFNHGFIPPAEYKTTERYITYTDAFSRNGYIVFRPDYRGHGESEGDPTGAYGSNSYTIDVLNAVSSIKRYKDADPENIGMWGHSMGGFITLRSMVASKDIKAAVLWAGVVASYPDLLNNWRRRTTSPSPLPTGPRRWRQSLVEQYGMPDDNPQFWNSISANSYLKDISGPIQLHHGALDASVPVAFSEKLNKELEEAGKAVELYIYENDDHNISSNLYIALQRSVEFFDKYLKKT